jgi:hypothetical protein
MTYKKIVKPLQASWRLVESYSVWAGKNCQTTFFFNKNMKHISPSIQVSWVFIKDYWFGMKMVINEI